MDFQTDYPELEALPKATLAGPDFLGEARLRFAGHRFGVELAQVAEEVSEALFDWRNVDDETKTQMLAAYRDAFRNRATEMDLHKAFQLAAEKGESNAKGFISALKGKMAEYEINPRLGEFFPGLEGLEFHIAADPGQEIYDHVAATADNVAMLVQTKMKAVSSASETIARIDAAPGVHFALGSELFAKVSQVRPELLGRIHDIGIENSTFTENATTNLEMLKENFGIDVPDSLGDALPYVSEAILTLRWLVDVVRTEQDLKRFSRGTKTQVQVVRTLILVQRWGVSALLVTQGATAGGAAGGVIGSAGGPPGTAAGAAIGSITGGVGGAVLAGQVNRLVKPHALRLVMWVSRINRDDLFYFQNKPLALTLNS